MDADRVALVKSRFAQAASSVREAQRLLPRRPESGSAEAVAAWRCEDLLARLKRAGEAWDEQPSAQPELFPEEV
jgi:hypothetical protein